MIDAFADISPCCFAAAIFHYFHAYATPCRRCLIADAAAFAMPLRYASFRYFFHDCFAISPLSTAGAVYAFALMLLPLILLPMPPLRLRHAFAAMMLRYAIDDAR